MQSPEELVPMEIGVAEVKQMLDSAADFVLIDCREQNEYDVARIEGARLIPLSEVQQRVEELQALQGQHVVVHCHHGGRSAQVVHFLRGQGFTYSQNMSGGIDAWSLEIDPTVPRY